MNNRTTIKIQTPFHRTIYLFILLITLASCGGGSDGGNTPWIGTKQLGVAGANSNAGSVATDTHGNVYVAGDTDGGLDGNTLTGTTDFFVTKYDSTGVKQ